MPKANELLRERAAGGQGLRAVFPFVLRAFSGCVNAETPPFGVGFLFAAGEPDDYLLSHG